MSFDIVGMGIVWWECKNEEYEIYQSFWSFKNLDPSIAILRFGIRDLDSKQARSACPFVRCVSTIPLSTIVVIVQPQTDEGYHVRNDLAFGYRKSRSDASR